MSTTCIKSLSPALKWWWKDIVIPSFISHFSIASLKEETNLQVLIPNYGETYELNTEEVKLTHKIERKLPVNSRTEVLTRLEKLKDELLDMETSVKEDMNNKELRDEDVYRINEKIKDLERQILNVIEG